MLRRSGIASLALLAAACSGVVTARGVVVRPAQVPVRAFPHVVVTHDDEPSSARLARRLRAHLSGDGRRVERMPERAVDEARASGQLGRASIVLRVSLRIDQRAQPEMVNDPSLTCGPGGSCVETRRRRLESMETVYGRLVLTVFDAQGERLQRAVARAEETGDDPMGARAAVLERLSERAERLVDRREEEVDVTFRSVDHPRVRRALAHVEAGRWSEAVAELDGLLGSAELRALTVQEQARVHYDLGQALRFDGTLDEDQRFTRAASALRRAVRLDPERRYADALGQLRAHRRHRAMVEEQEEARRHNFALADRHDSEE